MILEYEVFKVSSNFFKVENEFYIKFYPLGCLFSAITITYVEIKTKTAKRDGRADTHTRRFSFTVYRCPGFFHDRATLPLFPWKKCRTLTLNDPYWETHCFSQPKSVASWPAVFGSTMQCKKCATFSLTSKLCWGVITIDSPPGCNKKNTKVRKGVRSLGILYSVTKLQPYLTPKTRWEFATIYAMWEIHKFVQHLSCWALATVAFGRGCKKTQKVKRCTIQGRTIHDERHAQLCSTFTILWGLALIIAF